MPSEPRLIVDSFSEFREMLKPWTVDNFSAVDNLEFQDGFVYVIERQRFVTSGPAIRQAMDSVNSLFVLSLPFEGSETLINHCRQYNLGGYLQSGKLLLIGGGDMHESWAHLRYDLFLTKFHDFDENIQAANAVEQIFLKKSKPYKFLFLNGRERSHRKYMIEKLDTLGLLDQSLWSYLGSSITENPYGPLMHDGMDLMSKQRPVHLLERQYEVDRYRESVISGERKFVKSELFQGEWGDIYVNQESYIDTYFSLVTETVFDYPCSFRTEKIAKPLGMGHPFIVVANCGYYRDLKNLGFQTFEKIIDESFDSIDNNRDRLDRISDVVADLCRQDLDQFLDASKEICKYNQQRLVEIRDEIRRSFPNQFLTFLSKHERS